MHDHGRADGLSRQGVSGVPFVAPPISKSEADLGHALGMARMALRGSLGGEAFDLQPISAVRLIDSTEPWVAVSTATNDIRLLMPERTFGLVLERLLPGEDVASVADDVTLAVFEEAIEPLLLELERALSRPAHLASVAVLGATSAPADRSRFGAIVSGITDGPIPVILEVPERDAPRVTASLDRFFPKRRDAMTLPLRASLRFGYTLIALDDLVSLKSGDAFLLDEHLLSQRKAVLIVEEHLAAPCVIDGDLRLLTDPLLPARGARLAGWCGPAGQHALQNTLTSPEAVMLRLDFDGWTGFLDAQWLGALAMGEQLRVVGEIDTRVQIKLNGHVVGTGEIIQVSERFAARIHYLKVVR